MVGVVTRMQPARTRRLSPGWVTIAESKPGPSPADRVVRSRLPPAGAVILQGHPAELDPDPESQGRPEQAEVDPAEDHTDEPGPGDDPLIDLVDERTLVPTSVRRDRVVNL